MGGRAVSEWIMDSLIIPYLYFRELVYFCFQSVVILCIANDYTAMVS